MKRRTLFNNHNISKGDVYKTKYDGDVEVIEYRGSSEIIIRFLDSGNIQTTRQRSLLKGVCVDKGKTKIFGVGVNDYNGIVTRMEGDKKVYDKFYLCWKSMLQRCYDAKELQKHPSYEKNSVCESWHSLSNFKLWFDQNYVEGFQLDKDILTPFTNVYSPETCWFIPQNLNKLLAIKKCPNKLKGVYLDGKSYSVVIGAGERGKTTFKKGFTSEEDAYDFYVTNKRDFLIRTLEENKEFLDKEKYYKCYKFWSNCDIVEVIKQWTGYTGSKV